MKNFEFEEESVWLNQNDSIRVLNTTQAKFTANRNKYKVRISKSRKNGSEFLIPISEMNLESQEFFLNIRDNSLDDNLIDLVESTDFNMSPIDEKLKETRIKKIESEITFLNQKIESKKLAIFQEWSDLFFQAFSDSFSQLKNFLIELHLNKEQLEKFESILNSSLDNLNSSLNNLINNFLNNKDN